MCEQGPLTLTPTRRALMAELKMNPAKKVANLKRNFENHDEFDNTEARMVEKSLKIKNVMTKQDKLEEETTTSSEENKS
jgi:predicted secreted Zn-dependent protease